MWLPEDRWKLPKWEVKMVPGMGPVVVQVGGDSEIGVSAISIVYKAGFFCCIVDESLRKKKHQICSGKMRDLSICGDLCLSTWLFKLEFGCRLHHR